MATFRRLADGSWGLTGPANEIVQGQRVRVNKSNGSITFEVVGEILGWEGDRLVARILKGSDTVQSTTTPQNGTFNGTVGYHLAPAPITPTVQASVPPTPTVASTTANNGTNLEPQYGPIAPPKPTLEGGVPEIDPEAMQLAISRLGELVMIDYDVPDTFPNPSPIMYSSGFYRSSKSCWVGSKSRIPWRLLHRMAEANCTWKLTDLPIHEIANKVADAIFVITKEIRQLQKSVEGSIETAQTNLEEATEVNQNGVKYATLKTQEKHRKAVEAAIKRCQKRLEEFSVAARAFGIDGVLLSERRKMSGIVGGMKKVAHSRVMAWLSMVEKAKDTPFADDIESGEMPVGVALDYLADEGMDVDDERDNL